MHQRIRWFWSVVGALAVVYSVFTLGFALTSPDLRLRFSLVDGLDNESGPKPIGLRIQETASLDAIEDCRGPLPRPGDELLRIGPESGRTETFLEFSSQLDSLRNPPQLPGNQINVGDDPSKLKHLPWLVEEVETGARFIEIEFRDRQTGEIRTTWLKVQLLPVADLALTFVWLVLQLAIFAIAGLVFWYRPNDPSARQFYIMCAVTLVAFVGGYHWWVVAAKVWLALPFLVCALFLPAVTLHFFLVFPRSKPPLRQWPRSALTAVYAPPAVAAICGLLVIGVVHWLNLDAANTNRAADVRAWLRMLRFGVDVYLAVATVYFLLTLATLLYSLKSARSPIEQKQLRWILWGGVLAAVPVGYALYQAISDDAGFVLGKTGIPMFLASLALMIAFAVGIVRYKLLLVDQIISKSMSYYVASCLLTLGFSLLVAAGSLIDRLFNVTPSPQRSLGLVVVLTLAVVLLLWFRDLVQQEVDRRFFREKYQLDKALRRMNRAVEHMVDPDAVGDMMLSSCREVLGVSQAALYLRSADRGPFRLVAADTIEDVPLQFQAGEKFLRALGEAGNLQRVTPGRREDLSPAQEAIRSLRAHLVHALDHDGRVEGLVVLGERKNGAPFTAEDLTFLNALGQIAKVAFHSARIDQNVARLNDELQIKIEKITAQKRHIEILQSELHSSGALNHESDSNAVKPEFHRGQMKGESPAIHSVLQTVEKVAGSHSSVLLRGASGTGKELLAQVIHENSPRRDRPMIAVHCASLSAGLLESELFGHVKGAFTGAHRDKMGRFEAAHGGTLFLDEIGDISLETQVKLLRVLQERRFEPVGSERTVEVDVRLITATHQDLERLIAAGRFREDLYYRLNVISLTLPPLRERREDIFELALHFLIRSSRRTGKRLGRFDDDALQALEQYSWPGNIRELENVIERAVVLAESGRITCDDLPEQIVQAAPAPQYVIETKPFHHADLPDADDRFVPSETLNKESAIPESLPEVERLAQALRACGGNKAQAARMLGLPRSTYYSKLKKYEIA